MRREKLGRAVKSAIGHLENSIRALVGNDEKKVTDHVWRAAADSEYALFLLSLTPPKKSEGSPSGPDAPSKKLEIGPALTLAQDLLEKAKGEIEANELHEARKKVWGARGHLLTAQRTLEKRRKRKDT